MRTSARVQAGQWCLTLGYPVTFQRGRPPAVRIARVLRNDGRMLMTDGAIMGGDSGAPLFDLDGKVIAIGTMCDDVLSRNLHVALAHYSEVWQRLLAGEDFNSLARPRLGVLAGEGPGARVGQVAPGSAAERAGIREGDMLLRFGDAALGTFDELAAQVARRRPGDKVDLELRRGDQTLKLQVTLGEGEAEDER
jgi:S1-C subfamily serine protease